MSSGRQAGPRPTGAASRHRRGPVDDELPFDPHPDLTSILLELSCVEALWVGSRKLVRPCVVSCCGVRGFAPAAKYDGAPKTSRPSMAKVAGGRRPGTSARLETGSVPYVLIGVSAI